MKIYFNLGFPKLNKNTEWQPTCTKVIPDQISLDLRIGDTFKLIKKIGSGAFGEIYKGKR